MKPLVITKWEFRDILSSKKFLLVFFLQISVLILMIMFFNMFLETMESEKGISLSPALNDFASLDVAGEHRIFAKYLNHKLLDVNIKSYNVSTNRLKEGEITALLYIPEDFVNKIDRREVITLDLFVNYNDPKRSVVLEEVNSTAKLISPTISNQWASSFVNVKNEEIKEPALEERGKGEPLSLQITRKVMIAILLFLPLFLFGNMVTDSVVGEKERKTGEILIAMPLSHAQILLGKSIAVILTIAIQVAIWIAVVMTAGFDIKNPLLIYVTIVLTSIPIIGVTNIIASYSKNYKEAGIGISFTYIAIVGFLIIPTLIYITRKNILSNISPMTLVTRLFSGESIPFLEFMLPIFFIIIVSVISYKISIALFKRDDVTFGPRPGIIRLSLELIRGMI